MSVAVVNVATSGNNADLSSYATASINPVGNTLLLLWVYSIAGSAPNTPTATGLGLTWVEVAHVDDGSGLRKLTLFRAMGPLPTAGVITMDFGAQAQSGAAWSLAQFTGMDMSGTNGSGAIVQNVTNFNASAVSSLTVTLAAFGSASNATAGGFGFPLNAAGTTGTGFTQVGERHQNTPNLALLSEFNPGNDTTVDVSLGANTVPIVGIAVEIKIASVPVDTSGMFQLF